MTGKSKNRLAGGLAGGINGLLGGGGGMVLLPLLTRWGSVKPRSAFATCVAAIYPMCALSAAVYYFKVRPALALLLPYLLGGLLGGIIAGMTFQKVSVKFLRAIFGAFLLYAGVRYLL